MKFNLRATILRIKEYEEMENTIQKIWDDNELKDIGESCAKIHRAIYQQVKSYKKQLDELIAEDMINKYREQLYDEINGEPKR